MSEVTAMGQESSRAEAVLSLALIVGALVIFLFILNVVASCSRYETCIKSIKDVAACGKP